MLSSTQKLSHLRIKVIVYTGELLLKFAQKYNTAIIPIDSEHHAIFQILHGLNNLENVKKIVLTASGGPFYIEKISKMFRLKMYLNHPTWRMVVKFQLIAPHF